MCVGDELLEPPSCGQLPGHRMEGPPTALTDERLQEDRQENPRTAGKGTGGGSSRAAVPSECVGTGCSPSASVSTSWDSNPIREFEAKAAGQRSVLIFILVVILWDNMRQPRRGKLGDRQTCRGGGGADGQIPERRRSGSDRRSGRQADGGCLKGNRQFGDPVFPRSHHRRPPQPQAPRRPFRPPGPVLVAPRAAELPGLGQTAFLLLGDGVPQPVASPRLRGRGGWCARRRRPSHLLTLPGNRRGATPADCSFS